MQKKEKKKMKCHDKPENKILETEKIVYAKKRKRKKNFLPFMSLKQRK